MYAISVQIYNVIIIIISPILLFCLLSVFIILIIISIIIILFMEYLYKFSYSVCVHYNYYLDKYTIIITYFYERKVIKKLERNLKIMRFK